MYYKRLLEDKLARLARNFKTVLVVGARQVGKSTLLSHCFSQYKHITFDALADDYGAKLDPVRFLNNFPPPLILDEIQYCQQLLPPLKRYVDELGKKGQYFLTGSQNLSTLKEAAESMAGRIGIMQLDTFTLVEMAQCEQNFLLAYLKQPSKLLQAFNGHLPLKTTLYETIWRGGMPDILLLDNNDIADYFLAYVKTYIERDVRLLEGIQITMVIPSKELLKNLKGIYKIQVLLVICSVFLRLMAWQRIRC